MLDLDRTMSGLREVPSPPLPLARLVEGRAVEEVADLLPRLFNLCRVAQTVALRMALGLERIETGALAAEIAREHALKLSVVCRQDRRRWAGNFRAMRRGFRTTCGARPGLHRSCARWRRGLHRARAFAAFCLRSRPREA